MAILRKRMPRPRARAARSINSDGTGQFTGIFSQQTLAGPQVDPHSSLSILAVWNAVNIYANTIAGLDRFVAERGAMGGHSPAVDHPAYDLIRSRPNAITTGFRFFQTMVSHKKTHGNAYAEIQRGRDGVPEQLHLLDPRNVMPHLDEGGALWYRLEREHRELPARDVIHFAGLGFDGIRGYCPVTIARESLGLAVAEQHFAASTFGNGAEPNGVIEMPGDPKQEVVSRFRDNWNRAHQGPDRAGNIGILFGGMKWVQTAFSPEDAQLLLCRNFSVAEVARLFNLPQHMLGNLDKATFANIEEQNIQFYQLSLMPELEEMEAELDAKLFAPSERSRFFVHHDLGGLLRGNLAARTARDVAMFGVGARTINQLLIADGLNPIADAAFDKHWISVNNLAAVEDLDKIRPETLLEADPDDVEDDTPTEAKPPAGDDRPVSLEPGEIDAARALNLIVDYSIAALAGVTS